MGFKIEPPFQYCRPEEIISFACSDIIKDFISEECDKFLVKKTDYYSFYSIPCLDRYRQNNDINLMIYHKDYDSFDDMEKDSLLDTFLSSFVLAEKHGGFSIKMKYGHYIEDYFETLRAAGYPLFASKIEEETREYISKKPESKCIGNDCDMYINFVKKFALDNQQGKMLIDDEYQETKELIKYNDSNVSVYYVSPERLVVSCYASAMLYVCEFNEKGYVVYGQHNDYGYQQELKMNPDFDSDLELNHDRTFLKHVFKPEFILVQKEDSVITLFSVTMNNFYSVLGLIYDTEVNRKKKNKQK